MTSKFPFVFPGEAPQVSDQAMPRGEVGGLLPNVNEVHVCVEPNLSFSEWTLMVCVLCMYVCGGGLPGGIDYIVNVLILWFMSLPFCSLLKGNVSLYL